MLYLLKKKKNSNSNYGKKKETIPLKTILKRKSYFFCIFNVKTQKEWNRKIVSQEEEEANEMKKEENIFKKQF